MQESPPWSTKKMQPVDIDNTQVVEGAMNTVRRNPKGHTAIALRIPGRRQPLLAERNILEETGAMLVISYNTV